MDKDDIINSIVGLKFKTLNFAINMEKAGLAKFTGNQWNENWDWKREALNELSRDELYGMYRVMKTM